MNDKEREEFFDNLDVFVNDVNFRLQYLVEMLQLLETSGKFPTIMQTLVAEAKALQSMISEEFDYHYDL